MLQLQDLRAKYGMLQEDLDTSMAESEGYAEQLALAQHQIRQYEARIRQYEMDLDLAAGDLELMHGRAREAEKQVWGHVGSSYKDVVMVNQVILLHR